MSLPTLERIAGTARTAGPDDAVGGVPARFVAEPTGPDRLAELVGWCCERDLAVVARGAGTKLGWGHPPDRVDVIIDTVGLAGVPEHSAGDLVATVGAGTPLHAVQAVLASCGQRLALDPPSLRASIGGLLATAEAGPLWHSFGTPRDLLLGVQFARYDGVLARAGGKVVKNVAGYDLGKLLCGSYGTLGIITAATFRLHPLPAARRFLLRAVTSADQAHDLVSTLIDSAVEPAAIELDLPAVPDPGGPDATDRPGTLAVLLEGTVDGIDARVRQVDLQLGGLAAVHAQPPQWWGRYPFGVGDVALKLVTPLAELHSAIDVLRVAAEVPITVRGSLGVGVAYAGIPAALGARRLAEVLGAVRAAVAGGGWCLVLHAPAGLRETLDLWGPVPGLDLMRRVKDQFDPRRLLAPGRFVGGI